MNCKIRNLTIHLVNLAVHIDYLKYLSNFYNDTRLKIFP